MRLNKIISGGQTGADQAGLDAAISLGIAHGGWIPKGRLTESGPLPKRYQLSEMATKSYPQRTQKNILDSDGTVVFTYGKLTGGSQLTRRLSLKNDKPFLHIDLSVTTIEDAARSLSDWVELKSIAVLNVAGSRASKAPGIYEAVFNLLSLANGS